VWGSQDLDAVFAFPLHAEAARRFFESRGQIRPHGFTAL
jgi:hypothetical protein